MRTCSLFTPNSCHPARVLIGLLSTSASFSNKTNCSWECSSILHAFSSLLYLFLFFPFASPLRLCHVSPLLPLPFSFFLSVSSSPSLSFPIAPFVRRHVANSCFSTFTSKFCGHNTLSLGSRGILIEQLDLLRCDVAIKVIQPFDELSPSSNASPLACMTRPNKSRSLSAVPPNFFAKTLISNFPRVFSQENESPRQSES